MPSKENRNSAAGTVPVLRKANRVFEFVARSPSGATAKSLAISLEIAPATCYRILRSFVADGWLRQSTSGAFELSFGLVPLMRPLLRHEVLIETVRERLVELAQRTGITAKLSIRQGDHHVTIFSAQSSRSHAVVSRVGAVGSLAVGSNGAAFLGAMPDADVARIVNHAPPEAWKIQKRETVLRRVRDGRKLGCYFDNGSYQPNINSLSAPIFSPKREIAGVITLLGFPQDFAGVAKAALMRELKSTASNCSRLVQGSSVGATT
jgi:DNA-binding IclR family transcriptional regulator